MLVLVFALSPLNHILLDLHSFTHQSWLFISETLNKDLSSHSLSDKVCGPDVF